MLNGIKKFINIIVSILYGNPFETNNLYIDTLPVKSRITVYVGECIENSS